MADPTPDPHRDEPTPAPQEGTRPEADPTVIRPEQDESLGPIPGLLRTAAAEGVDEATPGEQLPAEEQKEAAGVEEEGIESGQIVGITIAVIAAVILLGFTVFWAFYLPKLGQTQDAAGSAVRLVPEERQEIVRAQAALRDYGMTADSTFTLPIGLAMTEIAEQYAANTAAAALEGEAVTEQGMPLAVTRQGFNVIPVELAPARAVRPPSSRGAFTAPLPETGTAPPEAGIGIVPETGEEVGIDEVRSSGDLTDESFQTATDD